MFIRDRKIKPGQIIIAGFCSVILIGALLLMLPIATRDGQGASFLDALFTSTSAACVTGLVRHDTWSYWSGFGQSVILLLIQIGGMGVVTIAIAVAIFTGKRIGLRQRCLMQESISAPQVGGIVRITGFIFKTVIAIEIVGTLLLALRFCPQLGFFRGLWYSLFHAVSAFCNAGFDLMGAQTPYSSLTGYAGDYYVNAVIMCLIVLGGIGFFVWDDVRTHLWSFHLYRLHTKIVLVTTALLLIVPTVLLYATEFGREVWGLEDAGQRFLASAFQSVTPRTAGFNTVNLSLATEPTIVLLILLMLTGGSPSSTAGGIKTTTLAAMFLCIRSVFKGQDSIQCFGRRLPQPVIRQAIAIFTLYFVLLVSGGTLICAMEGISAREAFFETASAIGTVGLSLGITPELGIGSQLILVGLMFFGRVGGLTMIYAVAGSHKTAPYQVPQENITVG